MNKQRMWHYGCADYSDYYKESGVAGRDGYHGMIRDLGQVRFDDHQVVKDTKDENADQHGEVLLYEAKSFPHHGK